MHLPSPRLPLLLLLLAPAAGCLRRPAASVERTVSVMEAPGRFEGEIAAFEAADGASPPPRGGVVFVGSSSIRLWPDLAADWAPLPVLNRGFGGSTLPEVIRYAPRVVIPYRPRLVVLYAGDNDLAEGRTPAQVLADYRTFVGLLRAAVPQARVAFVSIKPSPSRWALADAQREANRLVREEVARDPQQFYVDVFGPMLGPDGRPRPELFASDSLHMTPAGYAVWKRRLSRVVR